MRYQQVKRGQIWRSNENGDEWVVTRTYTEFLDSYAVLRRAGGSDENFLRVKVCSQSQGDSLPGFTLLEG